MKVTKVTFSLKTVEPADDDGSTHDCLRSSVRAGAQLDSLVCDVNPALCRVVARRGHRGLPGDDVARRGVVDARLIRK
jgi:hypothetical protein